MVRVFRCQNPNCGIRATVLGEELPKLMYCDKCIAVMLDRKVKVEQDKLMEARLHRSQTQLE